ncbi:hypothetical protein LWI29_033865 [Acer saccharum]|uniref:indole-3-glycerol-phosphate synthase n=1 Tax=Acer saccharum TaxID=4024 RepID=A0AA39SGT3_ACESA|nr:hypothetical protein LWI29_033865 [Acer saccharum]
MEGLVSLKTTPPGRSFHASPPSPSARKFSLVRRSLPASSMGTRRRNGVVSIRAQQTKDESATVSPANGDVETALKVKEWEVGMFHNEVAATQRIRIRRKPPHGTSSALLLCCVCVGLLIFSAPPTKDFVGALRAAYQRTGLPGLIAEVKKASLSSGILREDFDPVEIAQAYEKGGAACLIVLIDEKHFKGSFENLEAIRNAGVKCPLLCKEFIVDAWQIYYARTKGADAILLIAAVLPDLDIKYMIKICKMLGLATLVEVHNVREMDCVLGIEGVELIGINNRNLETFEVDISNTKKLLEGERGQKIREKDIIVNDPFAGLMTIH